MCSCMSTRPSRLVSSGPPSVWISVMGESLDGARLAQPRGSARHPSDYPRAMAFDTSGIERGADGIARYTDRPESLVAMLRATADRAPDREAVVELGGPRLTYRELWDGAARVAGGLKAADGVGGEWRATRLSNGANWVLAFWGAQLLGAVVVPVNARFAEAEVKY